MALSPEILEIQRRIRENISRATGAVFDTVGNILKPGRSFSDTVAGTKNQIEFLNDPAKFSPNYVPPAPSPAAVAVAVVTGQPAPPFFGSPDRAAREKQMAEFTGWDNNPEVRALQQKSWIIYVDTGSWNTAAQLEFYKQAEEIRKHENPMYPGSQNGPKNPWEADQTYPRGTTPGADLIEGGLDGTLDPTKWGGYLKAGIGVFFLFMIVSMFRR